ncbi:hypothetical protein BGZ60DRAFT_533525 [Tricladium varicosporioides]|nr:hypothetical protein BGZ60DRAFT_533525 [Hymenoscyphus varicosporioides]
MSLNREVDKLTAIIPRPVEMQVLSLGLSRTATMTMFTALNKLGYNSYHMLAAVIEPRSKADRHLLCWREALNYKVHGIGEPYSPADFDKILQYHSAVTDMPCVNFSKELIERFPNAKVVLTQRDPESWVKSVDNSIIYILSWRIWKLLRYIDPDFLLPFRDCVQLSTEDWTSPAPYYDHQALASYMPKHVAYIKSLVPPDNLLEFHPRDGWEPLCKFLGKTVPANEPFPFVNRGQDVANIVKMGIGKKLIKFSIPYLVGIGAVVVSWHLAKTWY